MMNFLRLKSAALARFRQRYPQYWMDMLVEKIKRERSSQESQLVFGQVLAVVKNEQLGMSFVMPGLNIVTDDGDIYYAQMAAGETPDDDFAAGGLRLGSATTAPTKADDDVTTFLATSGHAVDATYPQTADADTDNTGDGPNVVTWRFSYTTAEGNVAGIDEGAIVDNTTTPTAALTHFLFAAEFSKTSSDTLKVFVNHEFTGV
jgi:hypothetical protein